MKDVNLEGSQSEWFVVIKQLYAIVYLSLFFTFLPQTIEMLTGDSEVATDERLINCFNWIE